MNKHRPNIDQVDANQGQNYAMVIANDNYTNQKIMTQTLQNLPTVVKDRQLIVKRFGTDKHFDFDFSMDIEISSNGYDCSKDYSHINVENIQHAIEEFVRDLDEYVVSDQKYGDGAKIDTLMVYFLGHGVRIRDQDCVLGINGYPYPVLSLLRTIAKPRLAKKIILILDCCRTEAKLEDFTDLEQEKIRKALNETKPISMDDVIQVFSTEEGRATTDTDSTTFAQALDKVLEQNPKGLRVNSLKSQINYKWAELQKVKTGKVEYYCDVKCRHDDVTRFP